MKIYQNENFEYIISAHQRSEPFAKAASSYVEKNTMVCSNGYTTNHSTGTTSSEKTRTEYLTVHRGTA
jgi:hypothetical protein